MIHYAESIATKGLLNDSNAVTIASKGYIYTLIIEEKIIKVKKRGRSGKKLKKKIKVTVIFGGKKYIQSKIIKKDIKITAKDIDVDIKPGFSPEVKIRILDEKLS